MTGIVQDIRYALRSFRKHPGFTVAAVLTLGLGLGINAAVFTVTNAVLFKGSPSIDRNDRIVYIGSGGACCVSYPDFDDWRARAKSFDGMGAVADLRVTFSDKTGVAETYGATQVTAETFRLIGQTPMLGRDFAPSDMVPGASSVAILSYGFWERRYSRDPGVIGQSVRINGVPTTVIGVMARGFGFPQKQDLWVPLVPTENLRQREARNLWFAFGRMVEGVTVENARAEMDLIGRQLATAYPRTNERALPVVMNFHQFFIGPNAGVIYGTLWGAVAFVLLIACANLANLFLARALERSREVSVRVALGARRWRLVRQFLVESLLLATIGAFLGWGIATWGVRVYEAAANPPTMSWSEHLLDYSFDYRVVAYLMALSIGTGVLFGLAPALRLSKLDANTGLKDGRGATGGVRRKRLSGVLVVGETILAVVLLVGAGVMIRSFLNVYTTDVGARTENILTMFLTLPDARYPDARSQIAFFERLTSRLEAVPGVESVALGWRPPTGGTLTVPYEFEGAPQVDEKRRPMLSALIVSPAYFKTMGAAVLAGRDFADRDRTSATPVALVNQHFARTHWPGEDPIGKRVRLFDGTSANEWRIVVGVVSNIMQNSTRQSFDPLVYLPFQQRATRSMWVFARTRVPPATLGSTFHRELAMLDSELPIWIGPYTLSERLAAGYWNRGLNGSLFLILAGMALLLASIGLYAVIAQSVSARSREIGIRMAVGATRRDVLALVLAEGMRPVGIGLAIGLGAALAVTPVLKSQLVGVSAADPITFVGVSAVLVVAATCGCLLPARRAARLDPLTTLRCE